MGSPITIRGVRFSYCHLFQPVKQNESGTPKYSTTLLLSKSDTVGKAAIDRAIEQAINDGLNKKWNGVKPPVVPTPIYDGDGVRENGTPYGAECKGCWVFTARSNQAPTVVDTQLQTILDSREVYSGMYGNVSVTFYPYNFNGKKGVACGLNHVQKTSDGELLGSSRITASEAFQQDAAPASGAAYGGYLPQGGYSPALVQNSPQGYPAAPQQGYPAQTQQGGGYPQQAQQGGYPQQNPAYTQQGAAGYGSYPQQNPGAGYGGNPTPNGYGVAPGYGGNPTPNGYGTALGYDANSAAGYAYQVDPNTGEVLSGGYNPSGMPVAGI